MSRSLAVYMCACLVQALLAGGQISLKLLAARLGASGWAATRDITVLLQAAPMAITAVAIYAAASALWVFVLQNMPLNRAFLFVALSFVFVPIFSHFILGEPLETGIIVGTVLIIGGILVGSLI